MKKKKFMHIITRMLKLWRMTDMYPSKHYWARWLGIDHMGAQSYPALLRDSVQNRIQTFKKLLMYGSLALIQPSFIKASIQSLLLSIKIIRQLCNSWTIKLLIQIINTLLTSSWNLMIIRIALLEIMQPTMDILTLDLQLPSPLSWTFRLLMIEKENLMSFVQMSGLIDDVIFLGQMIQSQIVSVRRV